MQILILNPNTSVDMTVRLQKVGESVAAAGTGISTATACKGFPYISSRAEAEIAGTFVLEMIAERINEVDAVVIGAYGDPGLYAARELFDIPVVGMAEAAMLTACMLGSRFSVVTFTEHLVPWYRESVARTGLEQRLASMRVPQSQFQSVHDVQQELRQPLYDEVVAAVDDDNADVVILAGAPLAGLALQMNDTPAVLVDPVAAAVKQAESLVRLAPHGARCGSMRRPPAKASVGIDDALADWISSES